MFDWHKKEKPIQGLMGAGGGATGYLVRGAGGGAASGGYIISNATYTYHVFHSQITEPTTLSLSEPKSSIYFLMLGGGGGGGSRYGSNRGSCGGGGAGGYVYGQNKTIAAGSYPITVGTGGFGPIATPAPGENGTDTTFWGFTAKGGGGGGGADFVDNVIGPGIPGGCGGGANEDYAANPNTGGSATQPTTPQPSVGGGTVSYGGYAGGASGAYSANAGGGGGTAAVGRPGAPAPNAANGGSGLQFPAFSAPIISEAFPLSPNPKTTNTYRADFINAVGPIGYYGGGGGGVAYPGTPTGSGGLGGGGTAGLPGIDGTGGGAGGSYPGETYGGNGIVIIRYPT